MMTTLSEGLSRKVIVSIVTNIFYFRCSTYLLVVASFSCKTSAVDLAANIMITAIPFFIIISVPYISTSAKSLSKEYWFSSLSYSMLRLMLLR